MNRAEKRRQKKLLSKNVKRSSIAGVTINQQALNNAIQLHSTGQLAKAESIYQQVLHSEPNNYIALHYLGVIAYQVGKHDVAVEFFDKAIIIKPDYADAYTNRGVALKELQQLDEAVASHDKAIIIKPDLSEAYTNRGIAFKELQQLDEAVASYDKAIIIKPDYAEAYYNRGNALKDLQKLHEAVASFDKTIIIKPDYAEAYYNRGNALIDLHQLDEAVASYDKAISIKPDYAGAYLNKSLALLLYGELEKGWELYEWRWEKENTVSFKHKIIFTQPLWLGAESLTDKTILLHSEQGLGDTIQFCRYAKLVKALGARVVMEVPKPLLSLLHSSEDVDELIEKGKSLPQFDFHCPLMSLPLAFKTELDTIPSQITYLQTESNKVVKWSNRLGEKTKLHIGLVWSGSTTHIGDHARSITLDSLTQHLSDRFEYVCLQKELREIDKEALQKSSIKYFGDEINDFTDTAALCELMDVVISVDTSVAHLSGALGKPTWVLLPYAPDWRWLLERDDSPWYPSVKLYRQQNTGNWDEVFNRINSDLKNLVHGDTSNKNTDLIDTDLETPAINSITPMPTDQDDEAERNKLFKAFSLFQENKIIEANQLFQEIIQSNPTENSAQMMLTKISSILKETDAQRWKDKKNLEKGWTTRSAIAANYIHAGATVYDLGCGAMSLEKFIPDTCVYKPCDIIARDDRTEVCDFNKGEIPDLSTADIISLLGVVEYIEDVPEFLRKITEFGKPILMSYCLTNNAPEIDRQSVGWFNNFNETSLHTIFKNQKLSIKHRQKIDNVQDLFLLSSRPTKLSVNKKVLVLTYNNVGNFGDRLGYHILNSILPPNAEITFVNFKPWKIPDEKFDLLILGIGNSLFSPLMTPLLIDLLDRIPQSIGIFGTQYRELIPKYFMDQILDKLTIWYARFKEDILLYADDRQNVKHMGDWLISAFPMTKGENKSLKKIDDTIWQDLPLDRTIQTIQSYEKVFSGRLHPLLCSLTSASEVSYSEQWDMEYMGKKISAGKFKSMLLDIFGYCYPENEFFTVDREAVASYKAHVDKKIVELREDILSLL